MKQLFLALIFALGCTAVHADELMRAQMAHDAAYTDWQTAQRAAADAAKANTQAQQALLSAQQRAEQARQLQESTQAALATARQKLDAAQAQVDAAWPAAQK